MTSALEDSFESLAGALYLDGGFETAYCWVMSRLGSSINPDLAFQSVNPKSALQERVQRRGGVVEYRIVEEHGPPHAPCFMAEALVNGKAKGSAEGTSKKEAEAAAAAAALEKMRKLR
jgi:ribonuclease-3